MSLPGCCMGHLLGKCQATEIPLYVDPKGQTLTWRYQCDPCNNCGFQFTDFRMRERGLSQSDADYVTRMRVEFDSLMQRNTEAL